MNRPRRDIQVGDTVRMRNGKVGRVTRIDGLVYVEVPMKRGTTEIIGATLAELTKIDPSEPESR
jgi:hypothetical protein